MQPLSSYTLADPKVMQNPYPYYERLRAEDPVHFDEGIRTWLVTRHEDIVAVARNTEVFSDEMRVSAAIRSPFQSEVDEYMQREGFMLLDPADSIAFALHALATRPDLLARLRASKEQDKDIRRLHEEALRFYTPVPQLPRIAKQETVLGGKTIPQGAFVFLCWASGNRDPQRFAEPDKFDLDRTNLGQHLTFGSGVHFCLGAMLARQEMKCAIREIVKSVESLELVVPPDQLDLSTSMVILRGLKSLPVRIRTRAA